MAVDPVYGLNNFKREKILSESETLVKNVMSILLGKPGFYPSLPSLGMNIGEKLYMFEDDVDTNEVKAALVSQCKDFMPYIQSGDIDVATSTYKGHLVLLFLLPVIIQEKKVSIALGITLNEKGQIMYQFTANPEETQII
jgi:hypothetical protein